jgi:uncharacterized protein YceK
LCWRCNWPAAPPRTLDAAGRAGGVFRDAAGFVCDEWRVLCDGSLRREAPSYPGVDLPASALLDTLLLPLSLLTVIGVGFQATGGL